MMLAAPIARRALLTTPLAILLPTLMTPLPASAKSKTREGMSLFADNKVEESIAVYDEIISAQPAMKPYLWQRGLSLYYAERFNDGAEQFAADVAVNPNDTEEQIWHLLCLAQVKDGLAAARQSALTVGTDRRPVMRAAQALFLGKTDASALQAFPQGNSGAGDKFTPTSTRPVRRGNGRRGGGEEAHQPRCRPDAVQGLGASDLTVIPPRHTRRGEAGSAASRSCDADGS